MRMMFACFVVLLITAVMTVPYESFAGGCDDVCGKVDKLERAPHPCGKTSPGTGCGEVTLSCCKGGSGSYKGEVESVDSSEGKLLFMPEGSDKAVSLFADSGEVEGVKPGDSVKLRCEDRDGCRVTDIRKVHEVKNIPRRCVDIQP